MQSYLAPETPAPLPLGGAPRLILGFRARWESAEVDPVVHIAHYRITFDRVLEFSGLLGSASISQECGIRR
jgi:hypothetical protein